MPISISTPRLAFVGAGWKSVGGQLLASAVILFSSRQNLGLRARSAARIDLCIAFIFGISALVTAIEANLSFAAAVCVAALFSELLLFIRWCLRKTSA